MSKLNYVIGDATRPIGEGLKVLAHVVNNEKGWGSGIVTAISRRWPEPEAAFRKNTSQLLGMSQYVYVTDDIVVCNMMAQDGYSSPGRPAASLTALRACFIGLQDFCERNNATVHMPRICCGLGGRRWEEIEPIIMDGLVKHGINVTVYDLEK